MQDEFLRKAQYLIPKDCKRTDFTGMDCSTPSKNQGKTTQAKRSSCEIYSRSGFSSEAWQLNDSGQSGQVWMRPTHTRTHKVGDEYQTNTNFHIWQAGLSLGRMVVYTM